jgi:DNA segregation ATPase FtsK/SpoIIIE-like protein
MVNRINQSFKHFNVPAHVATTETFDQYGNPVTKYLYQYGPVITRYKVKLEKGLAKAIVNISNDIARFLCVGSMRVIEVIPGEPYIGLEIPNVKRGFINMRQLLESDQFQNSKYDLPMVIGKDIVGNPVVLDLVKAPHLLVAGTTGSGKSVGISTMLVSLLMRHTPKELRLILIDPKMLEFSMYHDIPHLLTPVITDVKQSPSALRWCVQEMERRYTIMSKLNVKKITDYNNLIDRCLHEHKTFIKDPTWKPSDSMSTEAPNLEKFPFIVIVVDEFADLILQLKKNGDIEGLLARLAAKARACGIHLILATQSPRADVITGVIRSNFPSQISFKVKSNQESRIIIDESGAESLLGMGDMLIKFNDGTNITRRAHGAYIKDSELEMFAESWRRRGKPEYVEAVTKTELTEDNALPGEIVPSAENKDPLYDEVVEFCRTIKLRGKKFSTSLIQRQFSIGYNRAARLTTTLEECGIVSEAEGGIGTREILIEVNSFD